MIGLVWKCIRALGMAFLEIVYKDAMELKMQKHEELEYEREKELRVNYKGKVKRHKFFADFEFFDYIILEVKPTDEGIADDACCSNLNYLKVSGTKVGVIVNFGDKLLNIKRLIF